MRSKNVLAAGGLLAALLVGVVFAQAMDAGTELAIIERVVKARQDLTGALTELISYYHAVGDITSATRAERELDQFLSAEKYAYEKPTAGPVSEAPVKILKYIPEADDYYTDGVIIAESRRKVRKDLALKRFQKVLDNWPESDKAPLAAYEMAQIYAGVYFGDYDLAAEYYKKTYELNPATTLPALVKAGDMYVKLERYDEAVEMYKLAVTGSRDIKHKEQAEKQLEKLAAMGY
ncbi:MAG: tetratricopeptide repeat protein [Planctomycetota bacterium]|jgi:tetratricopeptide (TPR) repeat protein